MSKVSQWVSDMDRQLTDSGLIGSEIHQSFEWISKGWIPFFAAGGVGPSSAQTFVCDRLVVVAEEEEEAKKKEEEEEEVEEVNWVVGNTLGDRLWWWWQWKKSRASDVVAYYVKVALMILVWSKLS